MKLALLGYPLSHSLSPTMHSAALASVGLSDWEYSALPVAPDILHKAVGWIRSEEYAGANVTVPHKETIIPFLDGLTPVAEAIGAVNTLVKRDGKLIGHNTDAAGFLADLYAHDVHTSNCSALILGAGGSAKAVVAALAPLGCEIHLSARRRDQAQALISNLQFSNSQLPVTVHDLTVHGLEKASRHVALIVNCTPLGMSPNVNVSPWFESAPFPPGAFVYDLVYNPAKTLLVKRATAAGLRAATGLGMLVEQGALAFEFWTGKTAPRKLMREAAKKKLIQVHR
ncbi:MAG TPA: shikimate dehydrogenase [Anaerolineales bacterium]|nr:shikimate dehydrogenase [Anaerolineales bacterium]